MKLSNYYGEGKEITSCVLSNLDDVIFLALKDDCKEITVTTYEYRIIIAYVLAMLKEHEPVLPIVLNGVDKIFGARIKLLESMV